ncbi:probable protein phosphatase 2C 27 [Magnolia sinica]|uniref:probable protein phosphatase 2C 27 n=1 Tax=Magnolia sinica TaxID=86752 RepID=UPI00265AA0CE|nr:probable protein phosphatase 2C 27 [Magnolia sinica]
MCVQDGEQGMDDGMEKLSRCEPFHSEFMNPQIEDWEKDLANGLNDCPSGNLCPLESICENTAVMDSKQNQPSNFSPIIRSGEWSDIGSRTSMEDTHVCIANLAKKFGYNFLDDEAVSFYGVFDGHGGKGAAHFVRENLPRVIVEDSAFPLELEKVVTRSFMLTDTKTCSLQSDLCSGTTVLTAMIFGRSLLVANAGDCRAVLSRLGVAIEMSKDHRPSCNRERNRIESLGGFIDDGYLNGQLGVTRALGDWHIEGMKSVGEFGGPLSAEPELKMITLSKEDEFLIIGSDGIWDVFTSQNAVDFARRRLQEHNDVKTCCKELVDEAKKRGSIDNLTIVMVSFHSEPPPHVVVHRARVRRSISAEGLHSLKCLLEGQ